jgi:hypothetical protein
VQRIVLQEAGALSQIRRDGDAIRDRSRDGPEAKRGQEPKNAKNRIVKEDFCQLATFIIYI